MDIKDALLQWFINFFFFFLKKLLVVVLEMRIFRTSNIQGADLADMQLISKFNKELCFLLCVTDIFSKYLLFAGKSVIPERFIRTFKIKIYKYLNSI